MTEARTYSTHEAARLAEVTYRQANHWATSGSLGVPSTGHRQCRTCNRERSAA